MRNVLWLWVVRDFLLARNFLSKASRLVALKRQKPYSESEQPTVYGCRGWAIYSHLATGPDLSEMTLGH